MPNADAVDFEHHPLVLAACELQPQIRECADQTEANRRVPTHLIDAFTDRGLYRLNIPASAYGEQAHPLVVFHVIEAIAHADPSTAWVVMIATEVSLTTGWLPNAVLSQMIGGEEPGGPRCRIAGSSRVLATAAPDPSGSGYRLTGQLNYLSGLEHANFVLVTFLDPEDGDLRMALLPRHAGEIVQTWDTMGLRGTGSHDWHLDNAFVQAAHTWRPSDPPCADGPQWRVPDRSLVAWIANAGHALGGAQGAIDDLVALATSSSSGDATPLREREPFRLALADAQAQVSAARAFIRTAWSELWSAMERSPQDLPQSQLQQLLGMARLANVHAVHAGADAVETLFRAAGANAAHRRWPLERRWRDLQVARQHGAGLDWNYDAAIRPKLELKARRAR